MAFSLTDLKKTARTTPEGRRIYPYQIKDDRYTAAIGYAIAYYERMVGRRQREFESAALLEFFGDPRLARGLVACLGRSYQWHAPTIDEELGAAAAPLRAAGVASAAAARARLYTHANAHHGGIILPQERPAAIAALCADLGVDIAPRSFERALLLDHEGRRVLRRIGPEPTVDELVARYNYHSLETALVHAEHLTLTLRGPVWTLLRTVHNLAQRERLTYDLSTAPKTLFDTEMTLVIHGAKDALGGYARAGRRVVRVLLRLLATHPGTLTSGVARVHLGGAPALVVLGRAELKVLGAPPAALLADTAWEADGATQLQRAWGRALLSGKTHGWRLRRDPEPLVGSNALVLPDFVALRGRERVAICLAHSRAGAAALVRRLAECPGDALVLAPETALADGKRAPDLIGYHETLADAIGAIAARLSGAARSVAGETPWQTLDRRVAEEGFLAEREVAAILGCAPAEALRTVGRWGAGLHVLPGVGVCAADALDDLRALLDTQPLARAA